MARVVERARNSRVILVVLILVHLVVISRQVDTGGGRSLFEQLVFAVFTPLQRAVSATVRGVQDAWSAYLDLRGVHQDNQRLQERIRGLEMQLQEQRHLAQEAERLRDVLELRRILPLDTVVAEVVARDGLPWFRTLIIDKGTSDGVTLNAPVLAPSGVVGRVIETGPYAAKVQLLLDRESGVGVLVERSRVNGVLQGRVGPADEAAVELLMKYVPALADVAVGDVVVTSGLDRIYPKGLVVGRIRAVGTGSGLFKDVLVTPSAGFDRLEEVLVVRRPADDRSTPESVR
jgi:rod shape-determining protein MreC